MKKSFLPITLAALLVLAGCGGQTSSSTSSSSEESTSSSSSSTPVAYEISIKDTCKTALTVAWNVGYAGRSVDLNVSPAANVSNLIRDGSLVIESDHPEVVSISGTMANPVGVGTAKISVKYLNVVKDSVDVTVAATTAKITSSNPSAGIGLSALLNFTSDDDKVESLYYNANWTIAEASEGVKATVSTDVSSTKVLNIASDSAAGTVKVKAVSSSYASMNAEITIPVLAVSALADGLGKTTVGYKATGLTSTALTAPSTLTMSYDGATDTATTCYEKLFVTFGTGSYDNSKYGEWMVAMNGGTLSLDAGTRKVETLSFDIYKTTAFKVYAGADDTATEIEPTISTGTKGNLYSYDINSAKVFVKVTDTAYDLSIYSMMVNVRFGERPTPTSVAVSANKKSLAAGDKATVSLSKVLPDDASKKVTWSLTKTEGVVASISSESGSETEVSIDATSATGSVTVTATSVADNTKAGSATIPVLSASALKDGAHSGTVTYTNSYLSSSAAAAAVTALVSTTTDSNTVYNEKGSIVFSAGCYNDNSNKEIMIPKSTGTIASKGVLSGEATTLTLDCYKYNNLKVYAGTDATGTEIKAAEKWTSGDHLYVAYDVYGGAFFATNTSTYNAGLYGITIGYWKGDVVAPTALTIENKTSNNVYAGMSLQLSSSFTPTSITNTRVVWSTSDKTKATVDSKGLVTGVAVGTVTITATSGANSTLKDTIELNVTEFNGVVLDETKLGLKDGYADATSTINGVSFSSIGTAGYGDGIQMRYKNSVASSIANTTAFGTGIKVVTFNYSSSSSPAAKTNIIEVSFGTTDACDAETVKISTKVGQTTYVVTPGVTTYTFMKIAHTTTSGTVYFSSINVELVKGA